MLYNNNETQFDDKMIDTMKYVYDNKICYMNEHTYMYKYIIYYIL